MSDVTFSRLVHIWNTFSCYCMPFSFELLTCVPCVAYNNNYSIFIETCINMYNKCECSWQFDIYLERFVFVSEHIGKFKQIASKILHLTDFATTFIKVGRYLIWMGKNEPIYFKMASVGSYRCCAANTFLTTFTYILYFMCISTSMLVCILMQTGTCVLRFFFCFFFLLKKLLPFRWLCVFV